MSEYQEEDLLNRARCGCLYFKKEEKLASPSELIDLRGFAFELFPILFCFYQIFLYPACESHLVFNCCLYSFLSLEQKHARVTRVALHLQEAHFPHRRVIAEVPPSFVAAHYANPTASRSCMNGSRAHRGSPLPPIQGGLHAHW